MLTRSATATRLFTADTGSGVFTVAQLVRMGCTRSTVTARLAAGRWQRVGRAVVLHNGALTREQRWDVGVLNCGPRAVLASFSAAEALGLAGWERDEVHVLAPVGVARPRLPGVPVVLHRAEHLPHGELWPVRRTQRIAAALVLAAGSFARPRPACGILAAGVQQRLVRPDELRPPLARRPKIRHRRALVAAVEDISMGAQALSEIDFARLCRRHRLPEPLRQSIRVAPDGRRRYLDAEWRRRDGRRVAAEVDGAIHLTVSRWVADQLRQNEVVLAGTLVLRFPSIVFRTEEALVADQLARALGR